MSRTLLIVSGGIEAVPGIRLAKEMGLHVVVSDMNPNAPGFSVAHDRIIASTYDVEATVSAAQEYHRNVRPINGVMCIASDVPLTVASVAAALNLPGIPVEVARLAMDKLAMKRRFVDEGVPVPWFSPVESVDHLRQIVAERGYPLVLKPVDSRGARGVLRLTPDVDLDWAYHLSHSHSPTGRVMVERFLSGPQVSTEAIVLDGVAYTPGFSDRNYEYLERYAPYIVENGGQQPSALSQEKQEAVAQLAEQAARALGITNGIAKGDLVLTAEEPKVIEIAARLSGGWFCTNQIPLGTGVDLVGIAIRLALGEEVRAEDLAPRYHRGVVNRYFFPSPGRLVRIEGVDEVIQQPWLRKLEFWYQPGDTVPPVRSHADRFGVFVATGDTVQDAAERADWVYRNINIVMEPA